MGNNFGLVYEVKVEVGLDEEMVVLGPIAHRERSQISVVFELDNWIHDCKE